MKKLMLIVLILAVFMLSSCSKIEETNAKEVANQLFEHIENGDYTSASAQKNNSYNKAQSGACTDT